jgi:hypothetical protein
MSGRSAAFSFSAAARGRVPERERPARPRIAKYSHVTVVHQSGAGEMGVGASTTSLNVRASDGGPPIDDMAASRRGRSPSSGAALSRRRDLRRRQTEPPVLYLRRSPAYNAESLARAGASLCVLAMKTPERLAAEVSSPSKTAGRPAMAQRAHRKPDARVMRRSRARGIDGTSRAALMNGSNGLAPPLPSDAPPERRRSNAVAETGESLMFRDEYATFTSRRRRHRYERPRRDPPDGVDVSGRTFVKARRRIA